MARPAVENIVHSVTSDGLRVVSRKIHGSPVECCGVAILAGSRDEAPEEFGLAHFVEHTIFKGTTKRRSHHIINRMESVGGELNAYTTKEETFVYTLAPSGNLGRAAELLADLVINSNFPDAELEKEREVVAEEIDSYLDSPMEAVYDDFEDIIFANSPLGHNILGSRQSISAFDSATCRRWVATHYKPGRMVFFYTGPASPDRVTQLVDRNFKFDSQDNGHQAPIAQTDMRIADQFDIKRHIDSHQAHTIMGCRIGGLYSPGRYTIALLNNILGGPGMNSRLNIALRERRGLVYSVDSSLTHYADCGLLTIYFGCDADDTDLCRKLVVNEIERIAAGAITDRMLAMARRQYMGQLTVSSVSVEQTALSIGRASLRGLEYPSSTRVADILGAITPADLQAAAATISPLSTLTLA